VSPALCKLLYDTVPEEWHVPVVFLRWETSGDPERSSDVATSFCNDICPRIEIYLNTVLTMGLSKDERIPPGAPSFRVWYALVETCYHEFGHIADPYAQELSKEAYWESEYACSVAEAHADTFAARLMARLADFDKNIAQPRWLGYLSIRMNNLSHHGKFSWASDRPAWLSEVRCSLSGGQMTTGDVARALGMERGSKQMRQYEDDRQVRLPNHRLIYRVAADLGSKYVDRSGREHSLSVTCR
jgi:hypothetical protein